jgi:hypothetical protein
MPSRRPALVAAQSNLKTHLSLALLLGVCLVAVSHAQRPAPSLTPTSPTQLPPTRKSQQREEDEVVRITTNLVQVDAVVSDSNGKPVTDLNPGEVQIYEDGRPRKSLTSRTSPPGTLSAHTRRLRPVVLQNFPAISDIEATVASPLLQIVAQIFFATLPVHQRRAGREGNIVLINK